MIDLISHAAGGRVVDRNDEFFAAADNLLSNADPVWKEGEYTDRGKWMDGWETRRRRDHGHDWCLVALGIPGRLQRVTVDTSYFTGNYPEEFSLEASGAGDDDRTSSSRWVELIPPTRLQGDTVARFDVEDDHR
ncbi:MAG: bifunctional allantoicase/OHCU decarboxylase, partial [Actinobacteria bacterium]|nr:bifunctional allantoicase/OHCU decarboxylase [Actinomycetota bacterium]